MSNSIATATGRAGEFFSAYVLETYGVEVHHVDRSAADLWCRVGTQLRTVQVKTASCPRTTGRGRQAKYIYHTLPIEVDWYCFVAMDRQLLLLTPASTVVAKSTSFLPEEFNEANQRRTIEDFIKSC